MPTSPKLSDDDPRVQTDAYISITPHLYEVVSLEGTGPGQRLHVRNCRTLHLVELLPAEVQRARLERAAPVGVPLDWVKAA